MRNERQAIKLALNLVARNWDGHDEFSSGMRALQRELKAHKSLRRFSDGEKKRKSNR